MTLLYFLIKETIMESAMLENLLSTNTAGGGDPIGQVTWTTPGTYEWIVPEGVTSVCCVVLAAGGKAYANQSRNIYTTGQGGQVRWKNQIEVTPGETHLIRVGRGSGGETGANGNDYVSEALGLVALLGNQTSVTKIRDGISHTSYSTPFDGDVGGGDGGSGDPYWGGASATFTNGTNRPPTGRGSTQSAWGGSGVDIYTGRRIVTTGQGGRPGGGGGVQQRSYGSIHVGNGGHGAVRIIWGPNRAYPDLNITDM